MMMLGWWSWPAQLFFPISQSMDPHLAMTKQHGPAHQCTSWPCIRAENLRYGGLGRLFTCCFRVWLALIAVRPASSYLAVDIAVITGKRYCSQKTGFVMLES